MAKEPKLTRARRRENRTASPVSGVYGFQAEDALAGSWISRFVFYAESADQAKARIREAGFHKRKISAQWGPEEQPQPGLPAGLGPGDALLYRSRLDHGGWTPWEQLPADYRHKGVADFTSRSGQVGGPIDTT